MLAMRLWRGGCIMYPLMVGFDTLSIDKHKFWEIKFERSKILSMGELRGLYPQDVRMVAWLFLFPHIWMDLSHDTHTFSTSTYVKVVSTGTVNKCWASGGMSAKKWCYGKQSNEDSYMDLEVNWVITLKETRAKLPKKTSFKNGEAKFQIETWYIGTINSRNLLYVVRKLKCLSYEKGHFTYWDKCEAQQTWKILCLHIKPGQELFLHYTFNVNWGTFWEI